MKARPSNSVRIIGGEFRRRILHFPDVPGLRPTPDRVRETLFNWLGQRLSGLTCLDAFAGSGALGFEAASRGAGRVLMLECEGRAAAALRRNAQELSAAAVEIVQMDALTFFASSGELFDVIFLDPPFGQGLLELALQSVATRLKPGGKIYAESPGRLTLEGFEILRSDKAGLSHYCLLEPV